MDTFLFDKYIFGPVYSRRMGVSLGVNLLSNDSKYCNFDCIYCECGWTKNENGKKLVLPKRNEIKQLLAEKLQELRGTTNEPDAITFAGNGEPTLHPNFAGIIEDTIVVRDLYSPHTIISVLSNATILHKPKVIKALKKVEKNILKLDSGKASTIQLLNQPIGRFDLNKIIDQLVSFDGKLIIQSLFIRGEYNGHIIDNTTNDELAAWLPLIKKINPEYVMLYPIDRGTPVKGLEKISRTELEFIARRVNAEGVKTEVYF